MRIVDLEYGMVVEIREGVFYLVRRNLEGEFEFTGKSKWDELSMYKDNLKHVTFPELDIIRVYKSCGKTFDTIFSKCNLELIWEREREIDWSKVPKWTKVQVKDFDEEDWENNYLIELKKDKTGKDIFTTTNCDKFTYADYGDTCDWWQCRIHESVEIKEEWYK